MSARISLISHASTAALRAAAFPGDEALDPHGQAKAAAASAALRGADRVFASPARRARETAMALGLEETPEPLLRDCDYGRWTGLSFDAVEAAEPEALALWIADLDAAPHGGESLAALSRRAITWLDGVADGHTLAVTHAPVIRAAILHAIGAPPAAFWRIDIAPLTLTDLRRDGGRWLLRASGVPL
ncbi:MAG: histidine phosphatase family protein [Parvibaculum sp.]|uniref:histidine phosphatase family protein n=1 Tax=Parvibaculum sp. TaxID=2024848 RepID=UPI0025FD08EB|nr:histidine phosphatase family protein [Parvibaculum sp.]MCE9649049.1 histidine phosphatase family protein [Parvibaculum sp.]